MDLNAYQKQAMRTSPEDHDRVKNGCLGLIGESGEIVDIVKKYLFQSKADTPLPVDKLIDEMGDVLWYIAETVSGIGETMDGVIRIPDEKHLTNYVNLESAAVNLAIYASDAYVSRNIVRAIEHDVQIIFTTLMDMCRMLDTTIEHVAEHNIAKLKKRYPDGFDPERSMNRPEYAAKKNAEQTESASGLLFETRNRPV